MSKKLNKFEGATTTVVNSNYVGEKAGEIISKAFLEADTISQNLITVLPDVAFQVSLRKIDYGNGRTNYSCGDNPAGAVTLSEKLLTPKKIMNKQSICKEDMRQIWSSASMGFSAHNDSMPDDVEMAIISAILADTAEATDNQLWNGTAATDGEIGGFVELFTADGSVIKSGNGITGLTAAISKINVISELEKVLNAIPVAIRGKADLIIGISANVANFYQQAMISAGISSGFGAEGFELRYGSYKLSVINGLADNTFVAYQRGNLNFGTGLMADYNEVRLINSDETNFDGLWKTSMVYSGAVQYVVSNEIVWYLSTT